MTNPSVQSHVSLHLVQPSEAPVLAQLLELYVHELSPFFPNIRVGEDGRLYLLEVNALPSLEPGASLYAAAAREGLDFGESSATGSGAGWAQPAPSMRTVANRKSARRIGEG